MISGAQYSSDPQRVVRGVPGVKGRASPKSAILMCGSSSKDIWDDDGDDGADSNGDNGNGDIDASDVGDVVDADADADADGNGNNDDDGDDDGCACGKVGAFGDAGDVGDDGDVGEDNKARSPSSGGIECVIKMFSKIVAKSLEDRLAYGGEAHSNAPSLRSR